MHLVNLHSASLWCPRCCSYIHRRPLRLISLSHHLSAQQPRTSRNLHSSICGEDCACSSLGPWLCKARHHQASRRAAQSAQSSLVCSAVSDRRGSTEAFKHAHNEQHTDATLDQTDESGSDEDDLELNASSTSADQVDEAITGYQQEPASASTYVNKSKAEAHQQVLSHVLKSCGSM